MLFILNHRPLSIIPPRHPLHHFSLPAWQPCISLTSINLHTYLACTSLLAHSYNKLTGGREAKIYKTSGYIANNYMFGGVTKKGAASRENSLIFCFLHLQFFLQNPFKIVTFLIPAASLEFNLRVDAEKI